MKAIVNTAPHVLEYLELPLPGMTALYLKRATD